MSYLVGVGRQVGRSLSPFKEKETEAQRPIPLLLRAGRPVGVESKAVCAQGFVNTGLGSNLKDFVKGVEHTFGLS